MADKISTPQTGLDPRFDLKEGDDPDTIFPDELKVRTKKAGAQFSQKKTLTSA